MLKTLQAPPSPNKRDRSIREGGLRYWHHVAVAKTATMIYGDYTCRAGDYTGARKAAK